MDESITMLISSYKENKRSLLPCNVDDCQLQQQSLGALVPTQPSCGPNKKQHTEKLTNKKGDY